MKKRPHVSTLLTFACWVICLGFGSSALAQGLRPNPIHASPPPAPGPTQPCPSPNGASIVFSQAGDLWVVSSDGGPAVPALSGPETDVRPIWSHDGRRVAFSRIERGNADLYLLDLDSGEVTRLTWHPADDWPSDFEKDGSGILFHSAREGHRQIFRIPIEGGEPQPLTWDESAEGRLAQDGNLLLFTRGWTRSWRQGYRGSAAPDLWLKDLRHGQSRRLTEFEGADLWPSFDHREEWVYYASDEHFLRNVWKVHVETGRREQVTAHRDGPVESPRISSDGSLLVYEQNGTLWRLELDRTDAAPEQVAIQCRLPSEEHVAVRRQTGARAMAVHGASSQIVIELDGGIFALDGGDSSAVGVAMAPSSYRESDPVFSPDGRSLLFASDRNGNRDLYLIQLADTAGLTLAHTARRTVTPFRDNFREEFAPTFSPDGRFIAYLRQHTQIQLILADPDGGREIVLAEGVQFSGLEFSPDSRWIAYSRSDELGNFDIYMMSLFGSGEFNLSRHPARDQTPHWSPDGRLLGFVSDRAGSFDVWAFVLRQADVGLAWERFGDSGPSRGVPTAGTLESVPEVTVDLAGVSDRVYQVTQLYGSETRFRFSPDGASLAFSSDVLGHNDLWSCDRDGGSLQPLTSDGAGPRDFAFLDEDRVVLLDRTGVLRHVSPGSASSEGRLEYSVVVEYDLRARRRQIFKEVWTALRDGFYSPHMHLSDWEGVYDRYEPRLEGVRTEWELRRLILRMAGELNASHLDFRMGDRASLDDYGAVGIGLEAEADDDDDEPGAFIALVVPGTPASSLDGGLRRGDRLLRLGNLNLGGSLPMESVLADANGKPIEIEWKPVGAEPRRSSVVPISHSLQERLRLEAMLRQRAELVRILGADRIGYVHLSAVDRGAIEKLERELRYRQAEKEAVVLDLRENAGGDRPEEFLQLLSRVVLVRRHPRGEERTGVPAPIWNRPLAVLIGPGTGSAAEIVAQGIRELGLGVLIGENSLGGVISASEIDLVDGSTFRIPRIGWYTLEDDNLEGRGVAPDLTVERGFEEWIRGEDRQIGESVRELIRELQLGR